jgi:tRNA modification GTPase
LDSSQPLAVEDRELLGQVAQRRALVVGNKADLAGSEFSVPDSKLRLLRTSAITGEGVAELRSEILQHIGGEAPQAEAGFLTSVRHQGLVRDSLTALEAARNAVTSQVPHEMLLLDLYNALRPLDEITGATTTDDILNLIFSSFCIGK